MFGKCKILHNPCNLKWVTKQSSPASLTVHRGETGRPEAAAPKTRNQDCMKTKTTRVRIPRGNPHRGFTLVELLVSITIIIALAALVFTVTGKVRASAQQTNAVAALRQIGITNVAYSAENNGTINVIRDAGEKGAFEGKGGKWVSDSFAGRMQPYLFDGLSTTNQTTFAAEMNAALGALYGTSNIRTMAGTAFSGVPVTTDGSAVWNPIAINDQLRPKWGAANPPLRVASFADPSETLYLTFGRYYFNEALSQDYQPLPQQGDKGIFCFLDGHFEMLSAPIPERFFGTRRPDS
jgi:prepilin-type N-terminal cleavage/methylation domain-containing protein